MKHLLYTGLILGIIGILSTANCFSQDPSYSQFYVANLFLNPALTGYDGALNFYSIHRRQWWNIRQGRSKFNTTSAGLSFYVPILRAGVGVSYNENVEGEGYLKWKNVGVSYSYMIPLGTSLLGKADGDIRLGLNLSYNWRDFNWDNLVFVGDLNPLLGIVGTTPSIPPGYESTGAGYMDVDAGIAARYGFVFKKKNNKLREEKQMIVRVGLGAKHLARPDQSLFPGTVPARLPIRWTLHGSILFNTLYTWFDGRDLLQIAPSFKIDAQPMGYTSNPFNPFPKDAYYMSFNYGFISSMSGAFGKSGLYGGIWHRNRKVFPDEYNTNSLIFLLGVEVKNKDNDSLYKIGMSYDYNITGLGNTTGGALEFSFSVLFPNGSDASGLFSGSTCPALR